MDAVGDSWTSLSSASGAAATGASGPLPVVMDVRASQSSGASSEGLDERREHHLRQPEKRTPKARPGARDLQLAQRADVTFGPERPLGILAQRLTVGPEEAWEQQLV